MPQARFYASLLGIPLAVLAMKHLIGAVQPSMVLTQQLCANPEKASALGMRTVYSGIPAIDQGFLCFIVPFFYDAFTTPVGVAVAADLLGLFGVVLAFFAMEGSRTRTAGTLLSWSPIFGMLCNLIGVSVAVPLAWIPCYEWYASGQPAGKRNVLLDNIQPGRAAAILVCILAFFAAPSVLMFMNLERSKLEIIIAAWQFAPLAVAPFAILLTPLFHWVALPTPQTSGDDKLFKARWRTVQSKSMVETSYLVFMAFGTLLHYGIIMYAAHTGTPLIDGVLKLAQYKTDPELSAPQNLASTVYAYFLLGDLVILSAALAFFSLLEDGIMGVLVYLVATVALGPAAGFAGYLAWREAGVQNPKLIVEKSD